MVKRPVSFDGQVFEAGKMFLMAAERCAERRPDPDGQQNVLLSPTEHCAVIACELFLKCLGVSVEISETEPSIVHPKPAHGHKYLLHNVQGAFKERVVNKLEQTEKEFLNELGLRFQASRYPYESNEGRYNEMALILARKLEQLILDQLRPDDDGNIWIG